MAVAMTGPKFYAWDRNGKPLAFGKLYTYKARTNDPKDTYQSEDQIVPNTNPVILNGEGYANVYLSGSYKMVLKDDKDNEIWSSDPVSAYQPDEWVNCLSATYLSSTSFKVNGNFVSEYEPGRRVRIDNNASEYAYSTIDTSVFAGGETTVTIIEPVITTGLREVCVSIVGTESRGSGITLDFKTLEGDSKSLVESKQVRIGDTIVIEERATGNKANSIWDAVDSASVTPNSYDIVVSNAQPDIAFVMRDKENQFVDAFGVIQGQDSSAALDYVATVGVMNFYPKGIYKGAFTFDNDLIINGNEAQISPVESGRVIKNSTTGLILKVFQLNAELGTDFQLSTDGFIETDELTEFVLDGCKIRQGGRHVWAKKTGKLRWINNQSLSSQDWGLYFEGATDFIIDRNIAAGCATHDGIKGGGLTDGTIVSHARGIISNNICRGNFRDGIDCAVNGMSSVEVINNLCYENIGKGIDLKILDNPTGAQTNIEHLLVAGNLIEFDAVGDGGLSLHNNDIANVDFKDAVVQGNYFESSNVLMDAIRVEDCKEIEIKGNTITNFYRGIRLVNSCDSIRVHDNRINAAIAFGLEEQDGGGVPTNNRFFNNDIDQFTQFANANTALVTDGDGNEFYDNIITKDPTSQYSLQAENLGTSATNTKWYNNILDYVEGAPLGVRTVVGDVFIDVDPSVEGSPEKWVAKSQTASSSLNTLHAVSPRGFRTNAGDPNGVLTAQYIGEEVYDSTNARFWRTWSTGTGNWK